MFYETLLVTCLEVTSDGEILIRFSNFIFSYECIMKLCALYHYKYLIVKRICFKIKKIIYTKTISSLLMPSDFRYY